MTHPRDSTTNRRARRLPARFAIGALLWRLLALAISSGASAAGQAQAQNPATGTGTPAAAWPSRPVRLVVPFPPGGSVDQVARLLAPQLSAQTGQNFIVENKSGGGGSIGTQMVARSEGDGHALVLVFDTHGTNPSLIPNLGFDTLKDLAPIALIGTAPMALVMHPTQPYKSFGDVLAAAKSRPGSVAFGTIGSGSLAHLAMTQIGNLTGAQFTHVPYRGGGPLMVDALGGQIGLSMATVFLVSPHIKSGKLKPLAVTSLKADPQLPGVAPIGEQGVPGFEALAWWGVFAPASVPAPLQARIAQTVLDALKAPAVAEKLAAQGMDAIGGGPQQLDRFLRTEIARWATVIRDNRIQAGD